MRVIVCGGRDYTDWQRMNAMLDALHRSCGITCIIEGGAKGADALARSWAWNNDVENESHPAKWDHLTGVSPEELGYHPDGRAYNKFAGFYRNVHMAEDCAADLCIGFSGGKGTSHMMSVAVECEIPTLYVPDVTTDMILIFDDEDAIDAVRPRWLLKPPARHKIHSRKAVPVDPSRYLAGASF